MTLVDPYDDSIVRYVIRRHQYDPETNHFRWFYESAFDNKREYRRKLQEVFDELGARIFTSFSKKSVYPLSPIK